MGKFNFIDTEIEGVKIIEPTVFGDARGYFMETYKESDFKEAGLNYNFIQDNQSSSRKGVLRGLHFQKKHPQAKLVRVLKGEVFDVAVDLRKGSPTYGQWVGAVLSEENNVVDIDAELPSKLLSPELLKLIDFFEPYGEANPKLLFQSKMLQIFDASICGKTERQHLKLTFNCENCKFPAMFWGEAERLDRDFSKGDRINVVYNLSKNYFNGNVTPQMILIEADTNLD